MFEENKKDPIPAQEQEVEEREDEVDAEDADVEEDIDIDIDEDLDIDENGDIILPDDDADDDGDADEEHADEDGDDADDAEDADEGDDEEDTDESTEEEQGDDAEGKSAGDAPAATAQPDAKDAQIEALQRELRALKSQSRETLARLGVKDGDEMSGLVKLAAEAEGLTGEEYLRRKAERDRAAELARAAQKTQFDAKIAADLAAVQAVYPDAKKFASVKDFPNFAEFGRLRDLGLAPDRAYIASHPDAVRQSVAEATRQQTLNDTKRHLKPAVSKQSKDTSLRMSKRELAECRELFPDMSDREIIRLYRQAKSK